MGASLLGSNFVTGVRGLHYMKKPRSGIEGGQGLKGTSEEPDWGTPSMTAIVSRTKTPMDDTEGRDRGPGDSPS
ncbi:hypothetical protein NDU88_000299 [Pleurodeles waltl]|uniref:Uncharacterized protein n=1 Tax=Pleurodeles waltl TaxID=8319 RepID=A0AAV7UTN6_PLEWA|nr:hypothetical protein NDU88_000299 [Pleurodeles waltl]